MTDQALALSIAVAADLAWGDPPNRVHPVAWIGHLIAAFEARAPRCGAIGQFFYGTMLVLMATLVFAGIGYASLSFLARWNQWAYVIGSAVLLKSTFSLRGLSCAARSVEKHLRNGELDGARAALRALVSRDTNQLGKAHVASAAIESVAENVVDSFVAPLFFLVVLGAWGPLAPAAALFYRAANTCDAMVGYRGRYEYLGKTAARLDDVLNLIPARIAAGVLVLSAVIIGGAGNALRILRRDCGATESPNAGWPMSTVAGALGVTLEKIGHYRLGDGPLPEAESIKKACRLAVTGSLLYALLCIGTLWAIG